MTTLDIDRAALFAAILAEPVEDLPRLAYADHLEEFGDEADRLRAEFIRVQIALDAPLRPALVRGDEPIRYREIGSSHAERQRERQLLDDWGQEWAPDPQCRVAGARVDPAMAGGMLAWPLVEFRRGFVEVLTLSATDWLARADALTAAAPIREVRLTSWAPADARAYEARHEREGRAPRAFRLKPNLGSWLSDVWPRIKFTLPE